jgi:hypothetical protein
MGSAMQTALLLARRFESYIEGFALQNSISDFATFDIGGVALEPYTEENMEQAKKARAIFESSMHENSVLHLNS